MKKLLRGLRRFRAEIFSTHEDLFVKLGEGQNPEALFITCSDSRLDPNLLTQTKPGDLFVLRTAGNVVPPHGVVGGGEGATIEFAVAELKVKDIIVCGHSQCGAVKGLENPEGVKHLPVLSQWLKRVGTFAKENPKHRLLGSQMRSVRDPHEAAVRSHVLSQLENLKTHPAVSARCANGTLRIHAWIYHFETGDVFAFNERVGDFHLINPRRRDRGRNRTFLKQRKGNPVVRPPDSDLKCAQNQ